MAKKAVIPPDQKIALDSLAKYAGQMPARLKVFWMKPQGEGGAVQITDPSTASGCFELPAGKLEGDGIEKFFMEHALLGATREYRVQVFLAKPDGEYPRVPNRTITLAFVDPLENAAAVAASREAQFQATLAEREDLVSKTLENAAKALEEATKNGTPTEELKKQIDRIENMDGKLMANIYRFGQTPVPQTPPQGQATVYGPGWPQNYPPPNFAGYPGYPPPVYPPPQGNDKLADALVSLVTSKPAGTDPAITEMLRQQGQILATIAQKLAEPPKTAGPAPEITALMARLDAAERAATEARNQAAADRRDAEHRSEMLEMQRKLDALANPTGKPNEALEFAKLQMQQQADNAKHAQDMLLAFQGQTNALQKEMRDMLAEPGPDQSQQLRQMAGAMSEVTGTMMGMMQQVMRMSTGGGSDGAKPPAWQNAAERVVGILAGLGQNLMESAAAPTNGAGAAAPAGAPALPASTGTAPTLQLAPAPTEQNGQSETKLQTVQRAQKLVEGGDFQGGIGVLNQAMDRWPDMIQANSRVRTTASLLDGVNWPEGVTPEILTNAYIGVFGEDARAELEKMVEESKAQATE